jgi:transposase
MLTDDSLDVIPGRPGQKWSRGQMEARLANMAPCLIGMEACVGAHR